MRNAKTAHRWTIKENQNGRIRIYEGKEVIAEMMGTVKTLNRERANIMKAAPKLLQALENICSDKPLEIRDWENAHAAISEARGK